VGSLLLIHSQERGRLTELLNNPQQSRGGITHIIEPQTNELLMDDAKYERARTIAAGIHWGMPPLKNETLCYGRDNDPVWPKWN